MCTGELGVVTGLDATGDSATVRVAGAARRASLLLQPQVRVGDHVLVHTGFVLEVVDPPPTPAGGDLPRPGASPPSAGRP